MKHILSIIVKNRPGVMSHVSGLFTRRGFNIDSIAVGVTDKPDVSIMTIVLAGDDEAQAQFRGQLLKLPDVVDVKSLPYYESLVRELVLIRVKSPGDTRQEILGVVEVCGGRIAEIGEDSMLIELTGNSRQVNGFIRLLTKFGITEIARTGQVALAYTPGDS
ncbi:MAG: acetolactate synthase small subunit [Spirochaetia bacterium]|nr:acetolactate synthase small subunit [Spirochaetia bacterium]